MVRGVRRRRKSSSGSGEGAPERSGQTGFETRLRQQIGHRCAAQLDRKGQLSGPGLPVHCVPLRWVHLALPRRQRLEMQAQRPVHFLEQGLRWLMRR